MKKLILSLIATAFLTAGASATDASLAGQIESKVPVVTTQSAETTTEEAPQVEESEVYFDAVEIEAEEVEVEGEGDVESL